MNPTTNRKAIRAAEKEFEARAQTKTAFLAACLDTLQGRLFFYDLIAECGVFHNTPSFDTLRDYFDSGQRNVGLRLQASILTSCPDAYLQMLKDENVRQSLSAARQQPGSPNADGRDSESSPDPTDHDPYAFDGADDQ